MSAGFAGAHRFASKGSPTCAVSAVLLNLGSRLVACRNLQALPRGSAHQFAWAIATSLSELWIKELWRTRTPQGIDDGNRSVKTTFPGRPASDRWPLASLEFYAAQPHRQSQPAAPPPRAPGAHARARARC